MYVYQSLWPCHVLSVYTLTAALAFKEALCLSIVHDFITVRLQGVISKVMWNPTAIILFVAVRTDKLCACDAEWQNECRAMAGQVLQ